MLNNLVLFGSISISMYYSMGFLDDASGKETASQCSNVLYGELGGLVMPSAGVELPACSCRLFGKNLFPLTTIPSFLSFQGLRCQLQPPSTASSPLVSLGSSSQACVRLQAVPCASDLGLSSRGGRRPLGFWGQRGLWGSLL